MTSIAAQPELTKTPGEVLPILSSFFKDLTYGDMLTGTPTVSVSPAGPTLSAASLNTIKKRVELPDGSVDHWVNPSQAVEFTMSAGTNGVTYTVKVTVNSVGGRVFHERPITVVVSNT